MIMENKTENQKQAVAAEKQQVNKGSFRGFVEKHHGIGSFVCCSGCLFLERIRGSARKAGCC
jgi:hypothetical protein